MNSDDVEMSVSSSSSPVTTISSMPSTSSSSHPYSQPQTLAGTQPQPITHTALTNPDILDLILENLAIPCLWDLSSSPLPPSLPFHSSFTQDVDSDWGFGGADGDDDDMRDFEGMREEEVVKRRKVLLSVALTNKAIFLEPSLDRLWRSLDKLFPLFRLLRGFYRSDSTFVLRGNVTDEDWERFDYYARRVKSFCYTRDPDSLDIAMHVYFRIAQLRKAPLLPSLRHLKCPHISQDDFLISSICLFLTPSLKTLDFEKITGVEDKLIGTFFHTLLCEGARIERVVLVGEGLTRDTLDYLGRCVWLRSLVLSGPGMGRFVCGEVVRSLGRLAGLEELEMDLEDSAVVIEGGDALVPWRPVASSSGSATVDGGSDAGGGDELGFRELTFLELTAPLAFVKCFLLQISATGLMHIGFESSIEGVVDRRDLLACISRRWKDTLSYLRMIHSPDTGADDNNNNVTTIVSHSPPTITMDTLSPLLAICGLTHFEIDGYAVELTDSDFCDMANAWDSIRTLHFPFMGAGTQRPSVIALRELTRCRGLRHLTTPLDTTEFGGQQEISQHRLQVLTIASPDEPWELRRVMRLARVIDQMFPYLVKVRAHAEEGGRWTQVDSMVKMCQSVRRDCTR